MMPSTMVVPVIKDIVKDYLGGENLSVAAFLSLSMLGSFLFAPFAGYISDKLQNRHSLISIFALADSFCFLLLAKATSIEQLLFYRFIEGSVSIFVVSLLLASISDQEHAPNSPYFHKGMLIGLGGMMLSLGAGLGLPLGILGRNNPLLPFYVAASMMAAIGICSALFLKDTAIHKGEKVNLNLLYRIALRRPLFILPCAYTFIDRFTVGFFVSSFNIHMRESLAFDPGKAGLAMGLVLIPMALLSYPAALLARKTGGLIPILVGSTLYGCCQILSGYIQDSNLLILTLTVCGLGAGLMFTPSMLFASLTAPKELKATIMSIFLASGSLGFMIGPLFFSLMEKALHNHLSQEQIIPTLATFAGSLELLIVLGTLPFYAFLRQEIRQAQNRQRNNHTNKQ